MSLDLKAMALVAGEATHEASQIILASINKQKERTPKGQRDFLTRFDLEAEAAAKQVLLNNTPDIAFFGEEAGGGDPASGEATWVLDPIDGTINFASGSPLCGVNLALYIDAQPVVGVISLPLLRERYVAIKGEGALLNGQPLLVSPSPSIAEAIVSIPDATDDALRKEVVPVIAEIQKRAYRIKSFGSAAVDLGFLSSSKTNLCFIFSSLSYDVGAGVLVCREAGAEVFDRDGSPHSLSSAWTIACHSSLKEEALQIASLTS